MAKEILQRCLVMLVHIFNDFSTKVEYVRTLAVALLSWTPWMDKLPGCVFVEESCEALLSRMASRCRSNFTVSSFEGVTDLFLTLPSTSRVPKSSRGSLRQGLLSLFWARCRRLIANAPNIPFAAWNSKGCQFVDKIPAEFCFPTPLVAMEDKSLLSVFQCAMRALRSRSRFPAEVEQFFERNIPRASPDSGLREVMRRLPRPQNVRHSNPVLLHN